MSNLLNAARKALEALERVKSDADKQQAAYPWDLWRWFVDDAITALRQAIEQAEQAQQYVMENAQGDLERISLVQTGVGIGKPDQKPVAWMCSNPNLLLKGYSRFSPRCEGDWNIPVYTTPPQRKPLTAEEIDEIYMANCYSDTLTFVRAIERAHGIGGGE